MAFVVIHVGPPKCGSTTIQNGLAASLHYSRSPLRKIPILNRICRKTTRYIRITPKSFYPLNKADPPQSALSYFQEMMRKGDFNTLVLSHEALFQMPRAVGRIAQMASQAGHDVMILGYSRRQDDFIRSSFSQWLFRNPERLKESFDAIGDAGFDPWLFSATERHMLAAVLTDFATARMPAGDQILNWHHQYRAIENVTERFGATFSVGHLPSRDHPFSLVDDALARCGIHIDGAKEFPTANEQFSQVLVEGVASAGLAGFHIPNPPLDTDILLELSEEMPKRKTEADELMAALNAYILTCFWEENLAFCTWFGLDPEYFAPKEHIDRSAVLGRIKEEQDRRRAFPQDYIGEREAIMASLTDALLHKARGKRQDK